MIALTASRITSACSSSSTFLTTSSIVILSAPATRRLLSSNPENPDDHQRRVGRNHVPSDVDLHHATGRDRRDARSGRVIRGQPWLGTAAGHPRSSRNGSGGRQVADLLCAQDQLPPPLKRAASVPITTLVRTVRCVFSCALACGYIDGDGRLLPGSSRPMFRKTLAAFAATAAAFAVGAPVASAAGTTINGTP